MNQVGLALDGLWKVLVAGLVLGAGLPAVFAVGIRSLAVGRGGTAAVDPTARANPAGTVAAVVCFLVVVVGVGLGIAFIVASGFGKALSFEQVVPTFVDK